MRRELLVVFLAGCSFAPTYERPAAPVTAQYPAESAAGAVPAADLGWREVLGDPRLQRLVEIALAQNRDLRIAALNVELTQATYRIQRSDLFPTVNARAGFEGSGNFEGDTTSRWSVGLGVTAFELDLWGRVRNLSAQALEEYFASEEARRSAHLSLVAAVASQYLTERALDEQLAIARQTVDAVQRSYEITKRTFEAGQRSELDVRSAEAQLHAARAEVARISRLSALAHNALVLLVGQPLPADLPPPVPLDAQQILAEIPAGLPSDLLARRPDILAAEHTLKGANYNIGAARAAFFPSISLTGFAGLASGSLSNLVSGSSAGWSFMPQINLPLFTGGRNQANLDASKVRKRIEIAQYEKSIQVAFREVADALAGRATLDEQLEASVARVEAEQKRYEISDLRYRTGIESYLAVLTAQRDLYAAQQLLIDVRVSRLDNILSLYKALGGGWRERSQP